MKTTKLLSCLITAAMLGTALPATAVTTATTPESVAQSQPAIVDSGETGECTWTLDEEGTLIVSGNGAMGDHDSYYWDEAKKVIIEDGVTTIGANDFFHNWNLESVSIPSSVTTIKRCAFAQCFELAEVNIAEGVTLIGEAAFFECEKLTSINLPNSLKTIESAAFYRSGLETLAIPEGIETINDIFGNCQNLTDILIPASVTTFSDNAFYNLGSGLIIYAPEGSYAHTYATEMNLDVMLPEDYLRDFSWTLDNDGTLTISGKGNMPYRYTQAPWGKEAVKKVIIEEGVTGVRNKAFVNHIALSEVVLPQSVKYIGDSAFSRCSLLNSITIPQETESIGQRAFMNCQSLTSIILPEGIKRIGDGAFKGCSGLTELTIPGSVKTIEYETFEDCTHLQTVTISSGVTEIGQNAFYGTLCLMRVVIPPTVESIFEDALLNHYGTPTIYGEEGSYAQAYADENYFDFELIENYPDLEWSVDENGVLTISGTTAMDNYFSVPKVRIAPWGTNITAVIIKDGVKTIGNCAFENCQQLKSVTIPNSVTRIGDFAFEGCSNLENISLPDSVTEIGYCTFMESGIKHLTIPDGVTEIFNFTFDKCPNLETVILPATVTKIGNIFDYDYVSHTKILIPESVVAIDEEYSFRGKKEQTIVGFEGSYAQRYAEEHDVRFEAVTKGDANLDGIITIEDATIMQQSLAEFSNAPGADNSTVIKLADVNGDGRFNIIDVTTIQRALAEL